MNNLCLSCLKEVTAVESKKEMEKMELSCSVNGIPWNTNSEIDRETSRRAWSSRVRVIARSMTVQSNSYLVLGSIQLLIELRIRIFNGVKSDRSWRVIHHLLRANSMENVGASTSQKLAGLQAPTSITLLLPSIMAKHISGTSLFGLSVGSRAVSPVRTVR